MNRRKFLASSAAGGAALTGNALGAGNPGRAPTPGEIEGPFYPVLAQQDKDFDLTRIAGKEGLAQGRIITIEGTVSDRSGAPVAGASVDLWQANSFGRYRHPHDPNPAPLDENFQGWAIVPSGRAGGFKFTTIFPGSYPAADGWTRPPHIHFKVSKRGYEELITQMYFPNQELNEKDFLLRRKTPAERELLIAEQLSLEPEAYRFEIVLESAL